MPIITPGLNIVEVEGGVNAWFCEHALSYQAPLRNFIVEVLYKQTFD